MLIELSYHQRKNAQGRVTQSLDAFYARENGYEDILTIFYSLHNTKNFISQERIEFNIITSFNERIFTLYKKLIHEDDWQVWQKQSIL